MLLPTKTTTTTKDSIFPVHDDAKMTVAGVARQSLPSLLATVGGRHKVCSSTYLRALQAERISSNVEEKIVDVANPWIPRVICSSNLKFDGLAWPWQNFGDVADRRR